MYQLKTITKIAVLVCGALTLVGCKTTEPMYHYGDYPKAVYTYLKADAASIGEQITLVEQVLSEAQAKSKNVAPGIHAHLGMLYFESGNTDLGESHFQQEKSLFPESAAYLDFLMKSAKGEK